MALTSGLPPTAPGPPRVGQENFEIHMHETPVGPSRVRCSVVRPTGGVPEQDGMVYLRMEGPARARFPWRPSTASSHVWRLGLLKAQDREIGPKNRPPPQLGPGELEFK